MLEARIFDSFGEMAFDTESSRVFGHEKPGGQWAKGNES
jgi:hypothetical protein